MSQVGTRIDSDLAHTQLFPVGTEQRVTRSDTKGIVMTTGVHILNARAVYERIARAFYPRLSRRELRKKKLE